MRRTSLARFVLFGAAGFGIGGTIAWPIGYYFLIELMIPIAGGLGGASLGLALRDRRKLVALALLGALGTFLGLLMATILGSFVNYSMMLIGAIFGTVLGASLGLAFLDLRRIVALALAGAAGFDIGVPAGDSLGPWWIASRICHFSGICHLSSSRELSGALHWERLWDTSKGAIRYSGEETVFSFKNCVVAEHDGEVIGLLLSFPVEVEQGASSGEPVDPVLEPYSMEVPGSFYICSLAVLPEFRGLGLGGKMLDIAREQARERGLGTLSLLVFEQNQGACRLYEREGFEVVDRAQVVPHELIHHTGDVLLMKAGA